MGIRYDAVVVGAGPNGLAAAIKVSANNRWVNLEAGTDRCRSMGADILTKEYLMSHIRVLICRVDAPASNEMTQLAAFDLPATDVAALQPETALDELETTTDETGGFDNLRARLQSL